MTRKSHLLSRYLVPFLLAAIVTGCTAGGIDGYGSTPDGPSFAEDRKLYFSVIRSLHDGGQSHAALAYLDDFDQRYPGRLEAKVLRGHAWSAIGEEQAAEQIFREVVEAGAVSAGHDGLGKIEAKRLHWADASRHFGIAAGIEPANAKLLNNLGYALLMHGRMDDAWSALARAAQLKPDDRQIRNNLLLVEYWGRNRDAAVSRLQAISDKAERDAVWRFISGWQGATQRISAARND